MIAERILADDGRPMEVWVNEPLPGTPRLGAMLIASAFGRRMHHYSALVAHLASNGFAVVRFDPLDHIGLSAGEIFDYTLTSGLRSLERAKRFTRARYPECRLGLVAISLSAVLAFDLVARDSDIAFLVTIAGVCDVRSTLEQVFSVDYTVFPKPDLPERVDFEGHWIDIAAFQEDGRQNNWWELDRTLTTLNGCSASIVAYHGEQDCWVSIDDLRACAHAVRPGSFKIITLSGTTHEVDRNLPVSRYVARDLVRRAGLALADVDMEPVVPSHRQLLETALAERRLQRASR